MKITPAKDYKKPLYAIGIAATIMAVAVTGCTKPVQYAGDEVVCTDETKETNPTRYYKQDGDEVILGGEAEMPIVDFTDETDETKETVAPIELSGVVSIAEPDETT